MSFPVEIAEFFADLPARIAGAHLVIGRAGASTVSELAVIGRASILVPFPHALDQDQAANAAALAASGGAIVVPQPEFTPERLAAILERRARRAGEARGASGGGEVGRRPRRRRAPRGSRDGGRAAGVTAVPTVAERPMGNQRSSRGRSRAWIPRVRHFGSPGMTNDASRSGLLPFT